jgi:mono/diheme cytochrome c family protein
MLRIASRLAALAFLATAAFGCSFPPSAALPPPISASAANAAKARFPESTEASLNAGRALFESHCNACHGYPDVSQIDEGRWPEILSRMGKKASLDEAQTHAVLSFVLIARSEAPPAPKVAPRSGW